MSKQWTIRVYQGRRKEWRWTLTGKNGEKVGASCEGFERRAGAVKNLKLVTGISLGTRAPGVIEYRFNTL